MSSRVVMLVDLDYFFAQVEQLRDPSIRDRPVVICVYSGRTADSGAVSTANYVARKYGVKSGMPIYLAKRKLEGTDALFLPVDHAFYEQTSEKVMATLKSFADRFEQVGIDEAYLDVTQRVNGEFDESRRLAEKVKDEVYRLHLLTCSIGVGPNKLIAKIAADMQKPNGLTVVEPKEVPGFLEKLPVNRMIGVGPKITQRMKALGISTFDDLSSFDIQKLTEVFGRGLAAYFHNASLGVDDEPVQDRGGATSISRIATLKSNSRELNFILEKSDRLCDEIYAEMGAEKLAYKTVGIIVVATDMTNHTRSRTLEKPIESSAILKAIVKELLERFLEESDYEVRRIGVKISNFVKGMKEQTQLGGFFDENR